MNKIINSTFSVHANDNNKNIIEQIKNIKFNNSIYKNTE